MENILKKEDNLVTTELDKSIFEKEYKCSYIEVSTGLIAKYTKKYYKNLL